MSKTRIFQSIKPLNLEAVAALLEAHPELKDERGRNALHFLCSLPRPDKIRGRSLALAQYLLGLGLDINEPAFVANRRDKTLFDLFSKRSPSKGTSSKAK